MKHILRGLGVMLLLWIICYCIGLVTTGIVEPWLWSDHAGFALGAGMVISVGVGFFTYASQFLK